MLALRLFVGATAAAEVGMFLASRPGTPVMTILFAICIGVGALALLIGAFTLIASLIVCAGAVALLSSWAVPPFDFSWIDSTMAKIEYVVLTGVLGALGPGAYSLDARLFGRREVSMQPAASDDDL